MRETTPVRFSTWRYPVAIAMGLAMLAVILCGSEAPATVGFGRDVHQWSTDRGIAALRDPRADREQKRRALVALHRNARAAISALEWTVDDPTVRDDAIRLLADIERELAKVEHR